MFTGASVVDVGDGPVALFVHGVFASAFLWSKALASLRDERRCVAIDLPTHGESGATPDQDLTLNGLARLLEDVLDALGIDRVDLVGNDTGGAICQVFAARRPQRIRSLVLTNTDAHDNMPPEALKPSKELAARGELAPAIAALAADRARGRAVPGLGMALEHAERLNDDEYHRWFGVYADLDRARATERFTTQTQGSELLAIEDELAALDAPTLIVWGTGDVFFDTAWAYWLRDHIGGAGQVVEVPGGKLFFPYERPDELLAPLRPFLAAHSPASAAA